MISNYYYQQRRRKELAKELNNKAIEMIVKNANDSTKIDSAIYYLNYAILLDTKNKSIYPNLANAFLIKKQYRNAIIAMQNYQLINLSQDEKIGASFINGIAYYCLGLEDSAIIAWTTFDNYYKNKEEKTKSFNDNLQRILVLFLMNKPQQAENLCNELIKKFPKEKIIIDEYSDYQKIKKLLPCNNN